MDYAQCLCFLGELYRDMEMSNEAIDAFTRGIALHEKAAAESGEYLAREVSHISAVSAVNTDQMSLERCAIMKFLAEE